MNRTKRIVMVLALFVVVGLGFSSCDFFLGMPTLEITNNSGWIAEVFYRPAGTGTYMRLTTVYSSSGINEEEVELAAGSYDFHIYDWVSGGQNYYSKYILNETLEAGIPYFMRINNDYSVSFF